jgi:hypothetical protein
MALALIHSSVSTMLFTGIYPEPDKGATWTAPLWVTLLGQVGWVHWRHMNETHERRYRASSDVVSAALPDGLALLDMNAGQYFGLNEVGALVWGLLQAPVSLTDLVRGVRDHFDIDEETSHADIVELLEALKNSRLVDDSQADTD